MNQQYILEELSKSRRQALDIVELAVTDPAKWEVVRAKILRLFGNVERVITRNGKPSNDGFEGWGKYGSGNKQ